MHPLVYHSVSEEAGDDVRYSTKDEIIKVCSTLRLLSPENKYPTVTFDDGYAAAMPTIRILCDMGVPTKWFISSWCQKENYFPKDKLRILFERFPKYKKIKILNLEIILINTEISFRRLLAHNINQKLMLSLSRSDYIAEVEKIANANRDLIEQQVDYSHILATKDEIRCVLSNCESLVVGSHGGCHYRWDKLVSNRDFEVEIIESQRVLQEMTSREIDEVAYPYGISPAENMLSMISSHYKCGYSGGKVDSLGNYFLPRVNMDGVSLDIASILSGIEDGNGGRVAKV